jgi:hypothetical protein
MAVVCRPALLHASGTALLVAAAIGAGSEALAQKPSQSQLNAMRQSCRSDYMAHCSTVPTGGAPALNCLKQNLSNLSPACQSAVKAIAPDAPAAAASEHPCDSSGPSCACAKCACAKCACGASGCGIATRHSAAKFRSHKQAQPSATQKCPPGLRRRVQNALRRYSAGRRSLDRLSQAQRKDFVGSVSAGTGGRRGRY